MSPQRLALRLLALPLLAGGLAGCGSHAATSTSTTGAAAAAQLRVDAYGVSLASVQQAIARLYRDHPAVARYATQDVSYTPQSRTRVLEACSQNGQALSANLETGRVLACAPLVFFFFSYGRQTGVSEGIEVADAIYSYASTSIHGPLDARAMLDGLLRGWGLPISESGPSPSTAPVSPAAAPLLASARKAILAKRGVRVTITGYQSAGGRPAARITADVGVQTGSEVIQEGGADASIRVTPAAAYVSGNAVGLTRLLGLPASQTRRAADRWLRIPTSSAEYKDLATENTIAALPTSVLPTAGDAVTITNARRNERPVQILQWTAAGVNGSDIRTTLTVSVPESLPLREVTASGADHQTVDFDRWGKAPHVTAPSTSVAFNINAR